MSSIDVLEEIRKRTLEEIDKAEELDVLDKVRVNVLGKSGELTKILQSISSLPKEERPLVGKTANEIRNILNDKIAEKTSELAKKATLLQIEVEDVDVTLPGRAHPVGSQHLISQIIDEMSDIFTGIGYRVYDGPQVETDYYNFTALNTPKDHPARSMQDTFYIEDKASQKTNVKGESDVVLRTQTSGVQIHTMEAHKPPIYMIAPGTVYRRDAADPSHLPQFTQIEGLVVDKGITFADLKGTLEHFVHELFDDDIKMRFRPHFFPFTEPSCEVDISCPFCKGDGCRFCSGEGWIEILGAGMVDPNVYGFVDIDPEIYSGFAFGIGVERMACLRYDLPDLRVLIAGDMRFLRQF